jgi:hypothetical protein
MDASLPRVQTEPVVKGPRAEARDPERRRRQRRERGEPEPQFRLDPRAAPGHGAHSEPRTPKGDGLGEHLDVTA